MYSIMGIDVGAKGAFCVMSPDSKILMTFTMEEMTPYEFKCALESYNVQHVFIEKAQTMRKKGIAQGVTGAFTYGTGFGRLLGWCEMQEVPHTLIAPTEWTKEIHRGCTGEDPKAKSVQAVRRLFPKADLRNNRNAKPHLGIVDAILITEYGRRIYKP